MVREKIFEVGECLVLDFVFKIVISSSIKVRFFVLNF